MDYQRARIDYRRVVVGAQIQAGVGQVAGHLKYHATTLNRVSYHGDELSILVTDEWIQPVVQSFEWCICYATCYRKHGEEGVVQQSWWVVPPQREAI